MTSATTTKSSTKAPPSGTEALPAARALRSDARRNRERVLAAAEEVFAAQGMSVPVDEIAKRAGVGVGTLYRHFPTKGALLEAVVLSHFEKFMERARELSREPDATQALFTIATELVELAVDKKDLTEELAKTGVTKEQLHSPAKQELESVIGSLCQRARAQGGLRCDVGAMDVSSLIMATCMAADRSGKGSALRLASVLCDGLRAGS